MIVTSDAELKAALAAANPGDTIRVAPGNYPVFNSSRERGFEEPVTIEAVERHAAVFAGLDLQNWGGLAVRGVRVASDASVAVNMSRTRRVSLHDCKISSAKPDRDPWNNGNTGIHIRSAESAGVHDCDLFDLRTGIYCQRSEYVLLTDNRLTGLREGINIAACDHVSVRRNEIGDFWPNYGKREHPDALQFWCNGETRGCSDVQVVDNRFIQLGRKAVHGMFMRSEVKGLRHKNIVVSGNLYYGSAKHGLSVSDADGVLIERNLVLPSLHAGSGYPRGQDGGETSAALMPTIYCGEDTTGEARHIIGPWMKLPAGVADVGNYRGTPGGCAAALAGELMARGAA